MDSLLVLAGYLTINLTEDQSPKLDVAEPSPVSRCISFQSLTQIFTCHDPYGADPRRED
ncbi:hypothetical protein SBA2_840024 [Acidobacteriia bacterium SbA2]|nr:hypothetical protein SBA2_840024 [Acidobacteriia bacterium SbA2]